MHVVNKGCGVSVLGLFFKTLLNKPWEAWVSYWPWSEQTIAAPYILRFHFDLMKHQSILAAWVTMYGNCMYAHCGTRCLQFSFLQPYKINFLIVCKIREQGEVWKTACLWLFVVVVTWNYNISVVCHSSSI